MSKTNFEPRVKRLKVLVNEIADEFYMCLHNFSELRGLYSLEMGHCFRCYFRQLFLYLTLRNCKKDCKIPKSYFHTSFFSIKTEIARFPIGFRLNRMYQGPSLQNSLSNSFHRLFLIVW